MCKPSRYPKFDVEESEAICVLESCLDYNKVKSDITTVQLRAIL